MTHDERIEQMKARLQQPIPAVNMTLETAKLVTQLREDLAYCLAELERK